MKRKEKVVCLDALAYRSQQPKVKLSGPAGIITEQEEEFSMLYTKSRSCSLENTFLKMYPI